MTGSARLRTPLAALTLVLAAIVLFPHQVSAHSVPISSSPADGATVQQAPAFVEITFSEAPDMGLSSISVTDVNGVSVTAGKTGVIPGQPAELQVPLKSLSRGAYVVTWRTVSTDDGHIAAGSFAFGVGVPASEANAKAHAAVQSPAPSAVAIFSRWVFFVAALFLLGFVVCSVFVVKRQFPRQRVVVVGSSLLILVSSAMMVEAQISAAGVGWAQIGGTSLAAAATWRGLGALAVFVACLVRMRRGSRQLTSSLVLIASVLFALGVEVSLGHAAAQSPALLSETLQFIHLVAAGIWIAGLATLLIALRSLDLEDPQAAVRSFSFWAGLCIVAVGLSGIVRAIVAVPSWTQLFGTAFGILVIVKAALFVVLAVLGATNRYIHVPRAGESRPKLQKVASGEVVIGVAVLAVAAGLVNVAPPARAAASTFQPEAPQVTIQKIGPGQPTLYTVALSKGRTLQVYLDPDKPGDDLFHMTYFDAKGNELPMSEVTVSMRLPGQRAVVLDDRPLDNIGHYVATANGVIARPIRFDVFGTSKAGESLSTYLTITPGN